MKPLNITLPPDVFQAILDRKKTFVSHKRNPRIDRFFAAKRPKMVKINWLITPIKKIVIDSDSVHIHIS